MSLCLRSRHRRSRCRCDASGHSGVMRSNPTSVVIPGWSEGPDLRCTIAHRGISRFSDVQLHIVARCCASPRNDSLNEAVGWSPRSPPLILVALRGAMRAAVMRGHKHQVSPTDLWRPDPGREYPRHDRAGSGQQGPSRGRPRGGGSLVDPDGRQWRTGATVADHRAMPQWRAQLAGGRMQPLQDAGEPAARRHPPPARHAAVETRGIAEMPVMPEGPLCAGGAHDQADGGSGDHALYLGAS